MIFCFKVLHYYFQFSGYNKHLNSVIITGFNNTVFLAKKSQQRKMPVVDKRCKCCFTIIHRGKTHKCNSTSKVKNIIKYLEDGSSNSKVKEQVVSSIIKKTMATKGKNDQVLKLASMRGKALKIKKSEKNKESAQVPKLTAENMKNIQVSLNLSDRKIDKLACVLRVATKNRNIIEPRLRSQLRKQSRSLNRFFKYQKFSFTYLYKKR